MTSVHATSIHLACMISPPNTAVMATRLPSETAEGHVILVGEWRQCIKAYKVLSMKVKKLLDAFLFHSFLEITIEKNRGTQKQCAQPCAEEEFVDYSSTICFVVLFSAAQIRGWMILLETSYWMTTRSIHSILKHHIYLYTNLQTRQWNREM